jgi:hypothetical protein
MNTQRTLTAIAIGLGVGYAAISFVAWSANAMEWNPVQRAAALIIGALVAGIMEAGKE